MFERILVAIDGAEFYQNIFEQALMLAKATQSELMLLHVQTLLDDFSPGEASLVYSEVGLRSYVKKLENMERAETEKLQVLADRAISSGVPTDLTQNIGDPGKMICAVAKTWNANLIVIGRRGLSGVSEMLMGSVSNYILHHAPCDVLTIQGNLRKSVDRKTDRAVSTFSE
jgi:nucleotide-binding universal stress UspA family protein